MTPDTEFLVVGASSQVPKPLPRECVRLPWHRDKRRVKTRLTKPTAAFCDWLRYICANDIVEYGGFVPDVTMRQIIEKVNKLAE
jgi:hypothetical protein